MAKPAPCRHHWLLDPPATQYSRGTCKYCNETRLFNNFPNTRIEYERQTNPTRVAVPEVRVELDPEEE